MISDRHTHNISVFIFYFTLSAVATNYNVIHGRAVHTGERSTYGEYYKIMAYSNTKEYINIKN